MKKEASNPVRRKSLPPTLTAVSQEVAQHRLDRIQNRIVELEAIQVFGIEPLEFTVNLSTCSLDVLRPCPCCAISSSSQFDIPNSTELLFGTQWGFDGKIQTQKGMQRAHGLFDTGASVSGLVSEQYVKAHNLLTMPMGRSFNLRMAEGTVHRQEKGRMCQVTLDIGPGHIDTLWCLVAPLKDFDIILGNPWIELHDPDIKPSARQFIFQSQRCLTQCCQGYKTVIVQGKPGRAPITVKGSSQHNPQDIYLISAYSFTQISKRKDHEVIAMWPQHLAALERDQLLWTPPVTDVAAIHAEDYEKYFEKRDREPMTREKLLPLLPEQYRDFVDVWDPSKTSELPPQREGIDHAIELEQGSTPPAKRPYGLSRDQALVVKTFVEDMLKRGHIRPSSSQYAAPLLIVKKPEGGLRVCTDYRELNALTIKDRNAPPLIRETLTRLCRAKFYTKLDIILAFNEVRIKEGHEHKTAFITRYGLYEYLVMPFGLCNAPGTFQRFINHTLREYLDQFCTAYLDDILVYSNSEEEHVMHVRKVLERLRKVGLFLDIKKCEFHKQEVKYLGLIVTTNGIRMDPSKVEAILEWRVPRNLKDVQQFLGFANFYRRFIKDYSKISAPLTALTRKDYEDFVFPWPKNSPQNDAFEKLKKCFTTAPILAHFDPDLETWVESDASDFIASAVLSQVGRDGILRPVAFLSHKMSPAECNYEIYDKELLAIIRAFEEWHCELAGTADPVKVLSDHRNLQYFMSTKQLNRRQARWAEFLAEFNFQITYRPGRQGTKPDSLTRRPGDLPEGAEDPRVAYQQQTILKEENLDTGVKDAVRIAAVILDKVTLSIAEIAARLYAISEEEDVEGDMQDDELQEPEDVEMRDFPPDPEDESEEPPIDPEAIWAEIQELYPKENDNRYTAKTRDPILSQIMKSKRDGDRRIPGWLIRQGIRVELGSCRIENGLLYVGERIYVPDGEIRTKVIRSCHDTKPNGHAGKTTTFARVNQSYYWPGMTSSVARYVAACRVCKWSTAYNEGKQGLLKPLPIPDRYWQDLTMDFIVDLPICKRYGRNFRHILVIVDRLSKTKRFIPMETMDVEEVVKAFLEWIWRLEGYPRSIVSDRGKQFVAHFWRRLCQRIGTKPKFSTAFHPETDGQTERANLGLKQYLRAYVNYEQDDWVDFLPMAEFEANAAANESTKIAPFMATKGYVPRGGVEPAALWQTEPIPSHTKLDANKANALAERIRLLQEVLKDNLSWARAKQAEYADKKRIPSPEIKVGDKVFLDGRNIKTRRPCPSLEHKNLGPYTVLEVIDNSACKLDLPESLKIYPVFHPWLLHLDRSEPLLGQIRQPPGPVSAEDEEGKADFEALEVVDSKFDKRCNDPHTGRKGLLFYKIKYVGHDLYNQNPDWQPYWEATGCAELVANFHKKNPQKPGPHKSFEELEDWETLMHAIVVDFGQQLEEPQNIAKPP